MQLTSSTLTAIETQVITANQIGWGIAWEMVVTRLKCIDRLDKPLAHYVGCTAKHEVKKEMLRERYGLWQVKGRQVSSLTDENEHRHHLHPDRAVANDPLQILIRKEESTAVWSVFEKLSTQSQQALNSFFRLDAAAPSVAELARTWGCSTTHVYNLRNQALNQIRSSLKKERE